MRGTDTYSIDCAPEPYAQALGDARILAMRAANSSDWLAQVLRHHQQIEAAFSAVQNTADAGSRSAAQQRLAVLLNGHAIAEEAVLYPALGRVASRQEARAAYAEHAENKMLWAKLDALLPMTPAFLQCLEDIHESVSAHMYHEEEDWLLRLRESLPSGEQITLGQRYREEFARYVGLRDESWRAPHYALVRG